MELTREEVRVLGCLVEKQRTVPDTYPLSLNALRSACNQSTNREPVVSYDEATIEAALDRLRERGLSRRGVTAGSRVIKYWQLLDDALGLHDAQTSLLAVLMLRGAQTPGELKGRVDRLHHFETLDGVVAGLDALGARDEPLVARLAREPGQKEARYAHLLGGDGPAAVVARPVEPVEAVEAVPNVPVQADGIDALRAEVGALRDEVRALRERVDGLA
ncbi:MAG TPA: YceH family protein [Acidimicrobiia bacterium]|nr:YceH family protein [Acidimicrobiia bacterium]